MGFELLRNWEARRKTILFVTHSIPEAILLADKVVVMTPRPGRLARVIQIDLPRPRTVELEFDAKFKAYSDEVRGLIFAGRKARADGGEPPEPVPAPRARRDPRRRDRRLGARLPDLEDPEVRHAGPVADRRRGVGVALPVHRALVGDPVRDARGLRALDRRCSAARDLDRLLAVAAPRA